MGRKCRGSLINPEDEDRKGRRAVEVSFTSNPRPKIIKSKIHG